VKLHCPFAPPVVHDPEVDTEPVTVEGGRRFGDRVALASVTVASNRVARPDRVRGCRGARRASPARRCRASFTTKASSDAANAVWKAPGVVGKWSRMSGRSRRRCRGVQRDAKPSSNRSAEIGGIEEGGAGGVELRCEGVDEPPPNVVWKAPRWSGSWLRWCSRHVGVAEGVQRDAEALIKPAPAR